MHVHRLYNESQCGSRPRPLRFRRAQFVSGGCVVSRAGSAWAMEPYAVGELDDRRLVRISSPPPFDILTTAYSPIFGPYGTRPDIVPGVPFYISAPAQPGGRRLNSAAFSMPADGQQGDLPRNYFRGISDRSDRYRAQQTNSAIRERVASICALNTSTCSIIRCSAIPTMLSEAHLLTRYLESLRRR